MDWSKAKNIIIGALIAANIFLGIKYWQNISAENKALALAEENTCAYLTSIGVDLQCGFSEEKGRFPVVFVEITEAIASAEAPETKSGHDIVLLGAEGKTASVTGEGSNSAKIISSSDAARRLVADLTEEERKGFAIKSVRLIYLVDRTGLEDAGNSDTAVPAWEFMTSSGPRYIEAFGN